MPKSLNADRELVKALFVQGFTPTQIARKTGLNAHTVATWSKRGGWTALRSRTCENLSQPHEKLVSLTIAERAAQIREALGADLAELVAALRQMQVELNLKHLEARADVSQKLAAASVKVFGWDNTPEKPTLIQVGIIGRLDPNYGRQPEPVVIEVQPAPAPPLPGPG